MLLGSLFHSNPHSTAVPLTLIFCSLCLPLPPFLSSYLLCHSTSPHLFFNQLSSTPPPPPPLLHDGFFSPSSAAFPFLLLPALLLLSYLSVQAEGEDCAMQEAKSTPAAAAPERRLVIFFRQNRGSCSSHWLVSHTAAAAPDCSQRTDRKIDRQRREREREKKGGREREKREGERESTLFSVYSWMSSPAAASCTNTIIYMMPADRNIVRQEGEMHAA